MSDRKRISGTTAPDFCIGRHGMDQIQAVEGIVRSEASHQMFAEFDARKLSTDERRREMIAFHANKP
jgi:hypothetical protein